VEVGGQEILIFLVPKTVVLVLLVVVELDILVLLVVVEVPHQVLVELVVAPLQAVDGEILVVEVITVEDLLAVLVEEVLESLDMALLLLATQKVVTDFSTILLEYLLIMPEVVVVEIMVLYKLQVDWGVVEQELMPIYLTALMEIQELVVAVAVVVETDPPLIQETPVVAA
jgi:hypothetical protein